MNIRKPVIVLGILLLITFIFVAVEQASADTHEECVPSPAIPATPGTPAIPATPGSPAIPAVPPTYETVVITEAVPEVWANWSPDETKGPQDYKPIWPADERGTWHIHEQGIPGGHEGPDGVYQQGAGNSPWFYRQAGVAEVTEEQMTDPGSPAVPAVPATEAIPAVPGTPAVPAVTCEDDDNEEPVPPITECPTGQVGTPPNCIPIGPNDCPDGDFNGTEPGCGGLAVEPCPDDSKVTDPKTGECVPVEPQDPTDPKDNEPVRTPVRNPNENPNIEVPGPGEEIVKQVFDGNGNLIEQQVSAPIPAEAQQEGM